MRFKWLIALSAGILFTTTAFFVGEHVGRSKAQEHSQHQMADPLAQMLSQMKSGDTLVIDEKDFTNQGSHTGQGTKIDVYDKNDYARIMSWFGLGATEAAAKNQGIGDINPKTGVPGYTGENRGYGILEQAWERIKSFFVSIFWILVIGVGALLVLLLIPATAPFAAGILKGLASLVPILGAAVTWILAKFKWGTPLQQTITGQEAFKTALSTYSLIPILQKYDSKNNAIDALNAQSEIKTAILTLLTNANNANQDIVTQQTVKDIKKRGLV